MGKLKVDVGDWVVLKNGKIRKITDHDMDDVKYEDIDHIATKEEVRTAIRVAIISARNEPNPIHENDREAAYAEFLEKRMYFFVPYNISEIQKGIQAGHAALEYVNKYNGFEYDMDFMDYVENHKTWIILNGGTTNSTREIGTGTSMGSLNQIADTLAENHIKFAHFQEPDLNDALTAVCFIADERVFNWKDYPDFEGWQILKEWELLKNENNTPEQVQMIEEDDWKMMYEQFVGGKQNVVLKELIKGKKLA